MFLLTRCRISMCQGLGTKKHYDISEIDRAVIQQEAHVGDGPLIWLENQLPGNRLPGILPTDWTRESWSKQSTGTKYKNHRVPWICVLSSPCFTDYRPVANTPSKCSLLGFERRWGPWQSQASSAAYMHLE